MKLVVPPYLSFKLPKSVTAQNYCTSYDPLGLVGKVTQLDRSKRILKYKSTLYKKWGSNLESHKRAIRGFKGRSEVAIAKPRINGKYVKKEVYQAWVR